MVVGGFILLGCAVAMVGIFTSADIYVTYFMYK